MARQPFSIASEARPDAGDAGARGPRVSRRAALGLAGGLAGVLALGWLADALAQAPLGPPLPREAVRQVGAYRASLTLAPAAPVAGRAVTLTAAITTAAGAPVAGAQVGMRLFMAAMDMSMAPLPALSIGGGRYASSVTLPMSGAWSVELTLAIPGQASASAVFPLSVR